MMKVKRSPIPKIKQTYWTGCRHVPENASQDQLQRLAKSSAQKVLARLWNLHWCDSDELHQLTKRLSDAVYQLRMNGWDVRMEWVSDSDGESRTRYRLESHIQGTPKEARVKLFFPYEDVVALGSGTITENVRSIISEALQ